MRRSVTSLVAAVAAAALVALPASASVAAPDAHAGAGAPPSASPQASAKDIKARYGTFTTKKVTAKGTKVIRLPKGATRGLVTLKASGKGTVKVQVLKKNRKAQGAALVAKRALPYRGTTAFGLDAAQYEPTYLKVTSTSPKAWSLTIRPLHKAPAMKKTQKGEGDAVFRVTTSKRSTWSVRYASAVKARITVKTYGLITSQTLVKKTTKTLKSSVKVDRFSGFLVVTSQGTWTIKR